MQSGSASRRMIDANGIRLYVHEAGPAEGPIAVLLHGFPETSDCWRSQIASLAAAGYHVFAPDQRGYGRSDKPQESAAYAIDTLGRDILGLIEAAGARKTVLIGHDWGGVVAWWLAARYPDVVERLVVLNAPHPAAFRRVLPSRPLQLLRSSYMLLFQIPWLPERILGRSRWMPLIKLLQHSSRPNTFDGDLLERYREAWSQPGAMTSMLNWYRRAPWSLIRCPCPRVRIPVLIVWGQRDRFLTSKLAEASLRFCDAGRLELLPDATHWLHHEEPQRINALIGDFLRTGPTGEPLPR